MRGEAIKLKRVDYHKPVLIEKQKGDPVKYPPLFCMGQVFGSGVATSWAFEESAEMQCPIYALEEPFLINGKHREAELLREEDGKTELWVRKCSRLLALHHNCRRASVALERRMWAVNDRFS